MRRHWKQILLAAGSALGSMIIAALVQDKNKTDSSAPSQMPAAQPGQRQQEPASRRDSAISFLSDVLAETYRKIRTSESTKRP